jgi:hypothetical protein
MTLQLSISAIAFYQTKAFEYNGTNNSMDAESAGSGFVFGVVRLT